MQVKYFKNYVLQNNSNNSDNNDDNTLRLLYNLLSLTCTFTKTTKTMPGYDWNRFVEASAELKDMTCSICRHVLCRPMVTKCCQSTYCESCIRHWLSSKKTCPAEKKPLKYSDGVHNAPTVIAKILKRQKIKCSMASKGCQEVS